MCEVNDDHLLFSITVFVQEGDKLKANIIKKLKMLKRYVRKINNWSNLERVLLCVKAGC